MKEIMAGEVRTNRRGERFAVLEAAYIERDYKLMRIPDGWTFVAHGCCADGSGNIEWEYSTDGHFAQGSRWNRDVEAKDGIQL